MFKKPLKEIEFQDLKRLKNNKIPESVELEYKEDLVDDNKLIKEICGFANSQGGYLIFGIREIGKEQQNYPQELKGISEENMNLERMEQVINTNINPRISVYIEKCEKNKEGKGFIIIYVPEGPEKPYYSNKDFRFYKRYNFETRSMDEPEISNLFKERFTSPQTVKDYLDEAINHHQDFWEILKEPKDKGFTSFGHLFIFPPNLNRRRLDRDKFEEFLPSEPYKWVDKLVHEFRFPNPFNYSRFGVQWCGFEDPEQKLEIHRNGLIHHVDNYGKLSPEDFDQKKIFNDYYLAGHIFMNLIVASKVYKSIGYWGPISIIVIGTNLKRVWSISYLKDGILGSRRPRFSFSERIEVEREWGSWDIENNLFEITKSIMDEFMNHFGFPSNPYLREGGRLYEKLRELEPALE